MATESPKLDYSDLPPGTRISRESIQNGLRIVMRGPGFWYELACTLLPLTVLWFLTFVMLTIVYIRFRHLISSEMLGELWGQVSMPLVPVLLLGLVVAAGSATIFGNLSYEIELSNETFSISGRVWPRRRWQRSWPKRGIRKISRWGTWLSICGQRGFRNAGIHGRRSDIKWLHRRLCELLLEQSR